MLHIARKKKTRSFIGGSVAKCLEQVHSVRFANPENPDAFSKQYGPLLALHDYTLKPALGFPMHEHQDTEILIYMLEGEVQHQDSDGNVTVLKAGDVHLMGAGSGISHSEYNHSDAKTVHYIHAKVQPRAEGLKPLVAHHHVPQEHKHNRLCPVVCEDGREGSLPIRQALDIYASILDAGKQVELDMDGYRQVLAYLIRGEAEIGGETLTAMDAAMVWDETALSIQAAKDAELLVFAIS